MQVDAFAGADLECVDTTGLMSVPECAPIGCPTRRSIRPVTRSGRLPNDAWAMTDPVTLTIPADRLRWSDLGGLFQRVVVVSALLQAPDIQAATRTIRADLDSAHRESS